MQDYFSQEMTRDRIRDLECELEYRRQSADGWIAEPWTPLALITRALGRLVIRRPVASPPGQSEAASRVA